MPTKKLITICFITVVSLFVMVMRDYVFDPQHRGYFFNLAMAWIPIALLLVLKATYTATFDILNPKVLLLAGAWLLFFPNSAYLIVDPTIHVKSFIDLIIYIPSMILGAMIVISSLKEIEDILTPHLNETTSSAVLTLILYVTSFGLYLGLFGRWNSWDLFTQPVNLLAWSANNLLTSTPFCLVSTASLAAGYFYGKKILNPSLI